VIINFALPFLQAAYFFAILRDDEKSHFVRFSSEYWKKYKRCFQPVCGKMNNHKLIGIVYAMQKVKISEFERMTSATNSVKGNESKAMRQRQ